MMNSFFETSMFAGVTLSLISYIAGMYLKKKFKLGIFNPRLNTVYLLDMFKVSADTIKTVEKEVICY